MRQILANALISGSTYALVGLGFGLILYTRRFFHLAHGGVITTAAYLCYALVAGARLPLLPAALLAALAAGTLGMLLDAVVYRPLWRRQAGPTIFLISSLGALIALENLLSLAFGDDVLSLRQGPVERGFDVLGARITLVQLIILGVAITTWGLSWFLLQGTRIGRAIRAVGSDADLAHLLGLPVEGLSLLVFFVSSVLGGIAGILLAWDVGLTPRMGFQALFMGVVIVVVGGRGSLAGIVPAALLLGLIRETAGWWLPTQWQDTSVFVVLLAFLALRPRGMLGSPSMRAGG
jgi:branched-chain amino acid transport system permease protein